MLQSGGGCFWNHKLVRTQSIFRRKLYKRNRDNNVLWC